MIWGNVTYIQIYHSTSVPVSRDHSLTPDAVMTHVIIITPDAVMADVIIINAFIYARSLQVLLTRPSFRTSIWSAHRFQFCFFFHYSLYMAKLTNTKLLIKSQLTKKKNLSYHPLNIEISMSSIGLGWEKQPSYYHTYISRKTYTNELRPPTQISIAASRRRRATIGFPPALRGHPGDVHERRWPRFRKWYPEVPIQTPF